MSKAKIFLIDDGVKNIKEMVETAYKAEEVLQHLLVVKPELLPGDQIDPENPRRWLLVKREMGVPGEINESDRWSLDHLFLDQDGIPTFVECKRASDTRNRREVVAQMLDYAANGIAYWSIDWLRQTAATTQSSENKSLDDEMRRLLDVEPDVENYWKQVEANLRAGKVRLVFVADDIPKELRRLVEFLNEKMPDVEVLAVEVKQFVGEGYSAVVPRVIGLTEKAREEKERGETKRQPLTREEFLAKCTPEAAQVFTGFLDRDETRKYSIYWGTLSFSARAYLANENRYASFVYGWFPNRFDIYLAQLPLSEQKLSALRQELLSLGIFQAGGKFTLKAILEGETLNRIPEVYDRILKKVDEIIERAKIREETNKL